MSIHLLKEVEELKKKILSLCALVEENVEKAVNSVSRRDEKLARQVVEADGVVDHQEIEVEEECLKILALHQPVAYDLRYVIAMLKINNDLERIGDLAVNIAEQALDLSAREPITYPFDFAGMVQKTQAMLRRSLDAMVDSQSQIAYQVCASDDEVDAIHRQMYSRVEQGLRQHPEQADQLLRHLSVSRNLERIADYATNIAEDVIYMNEGKIIRHRNF